VVGIQAIGEEKYKREKGFFD
jgi:hypothetical protein